MRETEVDFTFLCCTYNRAEDLRDLLESLLSQAPGEFDYEVLVIDNNSHDGTPEAVVPFINRGSGLVRYLFESRQGKSYALNTGLQQARGRVYVIADDDLVYPPDYLQKLHRAFQERPHASVIAGKVLPLWRNQPPVWLTQKHWSPLAMSDYGDAEFETGKDNVLSLLAAAYRRDHALALGGYNQQLGVSGTRIGGVEDADIMNRLYAEGYKGVYRPELEVFHKVEPHRVTRAYHRRWHHGHGRQHATMQAGERGGPRILGVPGHMYRAALRDLANYGRSSFFGQPDEAFLHETRLWFFAGFAAETLSQRRRDAKTSS